MCAIVGDSFDFISDLELSPSEDCRIDYSPFCSKAQALLFFLIHSPRPMVLDPFGSYTAFLYSCLSFSNIYI